MKGYPFPRQMTRNPIKGENFMRRYIDYEPIPFYFLNDTFNEEEVKIQLDVMKENGINAFFLHVRDGITDETYGTAAFFGRLKLILV